MANSTPTLNGVALNYVAGISRTTKQYAAVNRAKNGTVNKTVYGTKREWSIDIADAPLSAITSLRTIAALTTNVTWLDEDGQSFTVTCDADALEDSVEQYGTARLYKATVKIIEV